MISQATSTRGCRAGKINFSGRRWVGKADLCHYSGEAKLPPRAHGQFQPAFVFSKPKAVRRRSILRRHRDRRNLSHCPEERFCGVVPGCFTAYIKALFDPPGRSRPVIPQRRERLFSRFVPTRRLGPSGVSSLPCAPFRCRVVVRKPGPKSSATEFGLRFTGMEPRESDYAFRECPAARNFCQLAQLLSNST